MQELLNKLMSDAGLNAEQAQKAATTVVSFLKSKMPSSMSQNLDTVMSGGNVEDTNSFQNKAEDLADAAKDKLEDLAGQAKETLGDVAEKAEDFAKDALGKLKGMFGGGSDKA